MTLEHERILAETCYYNF